MKITNNPILALAVVMVCPAHVGAQTQVHNWTTIAGLAGSLGSADGTNSDARFNYPIGVAADSAGSVYVADDGNQMIRKIIQAGTNWVTSTIAGVPGSMTNVDGTNTDARFVKCFGMAVDSGGNLFTADAVSAVRKLTPVGTNWVTSTIAGLVGVTGSADGTNSDARFDGPISTGVDGSDNVYVADGNNSTIRKLTRIGTNWVTSTVAGLAGVTGSADGTNSDARFWSPFGIAADREGNVYVADINNSTIRKVAPVGTNWVTSTIAGRVGIANSMDGTNNRIYFNTPLGVAVDRSGDVYVGDTFNDTIRKLRQFGINWVSSTIGGLAQSRGSADGTNSAARFYSESLLTADGKGNVYVADTYNYTIRRGVPLPLFQRATEADGLITLVWTAAAGQTFQLQYNTDLGPGNWTNVGGTVTATNDSVSVSDITGTDPQRFYRVNLLQ